jgi:hypothetical protein
MATHETENKLCAFRNCCVGQIGPLVCGKPDNSNDSPRFNHLSKAGKPLRSVQVMQTGNRQYSVEPFGERDFKNVAMDPLNR